MLFYSHKTDSYSRFRFHFLTKTPPKERFSPEYFHIWGFLRIFAR